MDQVRKKVGMEKTIKHGITGKDVVVAVLDTGICDHVDFGDRVVFFKDFVNGNTCRYDDNGHGSHVCGIIGGDGAASNGRYGGMAPKCKLVVLKVLDQGGNGDTRTVLEALDWVKKNRYLYDIRLLNFSVGFLPGAKLSEQEALVTAFEELWELGITVVTASGNKGPKAGSISVPGISRVLLTVGAMDEYGAKYSGKGPTGCCIVKPEVLAPGSNIVSCDTHREGYVKKSGTSMAAPVVTGALALGMEYHERLLPKEWKLRMYHRLTRDERYPGCWGILHVDNLLGLN